MLSIRKLFTAFLFVAVAMPLSAADEGHTRGDVLGCGREETHLAIAYAKHRLFERQRARREPADHQTASFAAATGPDVQKVGNIVVVDDDGTLVSDANPFDLSGSGVQYKRKKKGVKTSVFRGDVDPDRGEKISIEDDDTVEVPLGFSFKFFGTRYRKVYLNSDGNLTFGGGESASSERSLARFLNGPPRIAAFFDDLDPGAAIGDAGVFVDNQSDFVRMTWWEVPEFDAVNRNTFQVTLYANGRVTFAYANLDAEEGIVGVSPGGSDLLDLLDLSTELPLGRRDNAVAERFGLSVQIDDLGVASTFLTHFRDDYDILLVWADFDVDLGNAFAYSFTLRNEVRGIGRDIYDATEVIGGAERFQTFVQMGDLSRYPSDPTTKFLDPDSTLSLIAHEAGHRFLAFVNFIDSDGQVSDWLLGRQRAHWNYFFDSDASVMEGNDIRDNGDGTFSTVAATEKYSLLDQYLMGLIAPEEVPDFFYVSDETSNANRESNPRLSDNFFGTRVDVTLDDVIAFEGDRDPSWQDARKTLKTAFLVIGTSGQPVSGGAKTKVNTFRKRWQSSFPQLTDGNGKVKSKLKKRKN